MWNFSFVRTCNGLWMAFVSLFTDLGTLTSLRNQAITSFFFFFYSFLI